MKRILFALALVLMLSVCLVGQAFALNYPYAITSNDEPEDDDHPWGGEGIGTEPPPPTKYDDVSTFATSTTYTTGIIIIDYAFSLFLSEQASLVKQETVKQERSKYQSRVSKHLSLKNERIRR